MLLILRQLSQPHQQPGTASSIVQAWPCTSMYLRALSQREASSYHLDYYPVLYSVIPGMHPVQQPSRDPVSRYP